MEHVFNCTTEYEASLLLTMGVFDYDPDQPRDENGRWTEGSGAPDLSYQGKAYPKAAGSGITLESLHKYVEQLPPKVKEQNKEALAVIEKVKGNPDAEITIYRAAPGESINNGDYVFIDREHAERWAKTPFGRPKPGFKVLEKKVKASQVDWTKKNLEFAYKE